MNILNSLNVDNDKKYQNTIGSRISFSGVGIHNGKAVDMVLHPAPANTGILFKRIDLKKNNVVKTSHENLVRSKFCSKLVNETNVSVSTVEHLLAALQALCIDNVIVEINSPELPAMDGSAYEFTYKILEIGRKNLNVPRKYLKIKKKISAQIGNRWVNVTPSNNLFLNLLRMEI